MTTTKVYWGDGTGDCVRVDHTGAVGSSSMTITSDDNHTLAVRNITVALKSAINGATLATIAVTQQPRSRAFSAGFSAAFE